MKYAHMACILEWAKEKRSATCELCGKPWREDLRPRLNAVIEEANRRRQAAAATANGAEHTVIRMPFAVRSRIFLESFVHLPRNWVLCAAKRVRRGYASCTAPAALCLRPP